MKLSWGRSKRKNGGREKRPGADRGTGSVDASLAAVDESEEREQAAIRIQAIARGRAARRSSASLARSTVAASAETKKLGLYRERESAATRIQALARGRATRRDAKLPRETHSTPPKRGGSQGTPSPKREHFLAVELREQLSEASKELSRVEGVLRAEQKKRYAAEDAQRVLQTKSGNKVVIESLQMKLKECEARLEKERTALMRAIEKEKILMDNVKEAKASQRKAEAASVEARLHL